MVILNSFIYTLKIFQYIIRYLTFQIRNFPVIIKSVSNRLFAALN